MGLTVTITTPLDPTEEAMILRMLGGDRVSQTLQVTVDNDAIRAITEDAIAAMKRGEGDVDLPATADPEPITDPAAAFGEPVHIVPPAPPPVPGVSSVDVDADGLPWDARIHASGANGKPKNADGRWRAKRGVSEETTASVTAELRQTMGAPVPLAPAAAPAVTPPPPPPATTPADGTPPLSTNGPSATSVVSPSDVPPPPPASGPQAFAALMAKITPAVTAGKLAMPDVVSMVLAVGLPTVGALMSRPDLIPTIEAQVDLLIQTAG